MVGHRAARMAARAAVALTVGAVLVGVGGTVLGANTRLVYFGSPADVGGSGGGLDASGNPVPGELVFSPSTVSTTTVTSTATFAKLVAFRLEVANAGGQTLNHVTILGGAVAGQSVNPLYPPPTSIGPSLPDGFAYVAVLDTTGIPVAGCSISTTSATDDSLHCDLGQIPAGQPAAVLSVVMRAPASLGTGVTSLAVRPWVELQLNEGSSTSGNNADSFYAIGKAGGLVVSPSTQDSVESYIVPAGGSLATDDLFRASSSDPTTTRVGVPTTANGDDAKVVETGHPTDSAPGCAPASPKLTCFGQTSTITVIKPVNLTETTSTPDTFTAANPLRVDLRWDTSELPGGATASKLQVVHDGLVVGTVCGTDPPAATQVLPCRLPTSKFSDRDLGITVYAATNGSWKPGY